jgi:hypothetical protein
MSPLLNEATLNDLIGELGNRFSDLVIAGICKFDFSDNCDAGDAYFYVNGSETQRRGLISVLKDYNLDHENYNIDNLGDEDEDHLAFGL